MKRISYKAKSFFLGLKLISKHFVSKIRVFFRPKKIRIASAAILAIVVILGWHRFGAFAQSVIDSFTDSSKIAATWNTYVDTNNGQITLAQKMCDSGVWNCTANNICADDLGDGSYIIVAKADAPSTKSWKTSNSNCDIPQCGQDGGQDGDNLTEDNTVNLSAYPARDYCKSIGGRMPTLTEMQCVYANRANFGNNFASTYYWTSAENGTSSAWGIVCSSNNPATGSKTTLRYVRCVMGW